MEYTRVAISLLHYSQRDAEILMALMVEIGFESFLENETDFEAFIPSGQFNLAALNKLQEEIKGIPFQYTVNTIAPRNWNEVWEQNYFKPIMIANQCVVRSPFHAEFHEARYQIVIEPKMAFGTGHHETTSMMMEHIIELNMEGSRVLDMGCGSGILGILSSLTGAAGVTGVDIDMACIENTLENCRLNNIRNVSALMGNVSAILPLEPFNVILANINRNVLLADLPAYCKKLSAGGTMVLSGFYMKDLGLIDTLVTSEGLFKKTVKENNHWVAVSYEKKL